MATLYVTEPGARVEKEYHRLLVTSRDDEILMRVPLAHVSEVVLVGWVGVTTPAILTLLRAGVGLSFVSRSGRLEGRLTPPTPRNIPLRHLQYERAQDPAFCLEVARAIVGGKLRNQRTMARRICRKRGGGTEIAAISRAIRQVGEASGMGQLRGLEGAGARAYFALLRRALRQGWEFAKRTRRPPKDPVNAMLSLGYTLLTQNLMTACEVAGLDPYDGFFHADKYGRPALALDLVEEFRSLIVDSVVLTVVNKRIIKPGDFEPGRKGGVVLKRGALRRFFSQYSGRLQTKVSHPLARRRLTYQKCFEVQARVLRSVIEGEREVYLPFLTR